MLVSHKRMIVGARVNSLPLRGGESCVRAVLLTQPTFKLTNRSFFEPRTMGYIMSSQCHHVVHGKSSVARFIGLGLCAGRTANSCLVCRPTTRTRYPVKPDPACRTAEAACSCGL